MLSVKSVRIDPRTGRIFALLVRLKCAKSGKERYAYFARLDEEPCVEGVPPGVWAPADEVLIDV